MLWVGDTSGPWSQPSVALGMSLHAGAGCAVLWVTSSQGKPGAAPVFVSLESWAKQRSFQFCVRVLEELPQEEATCGEPGAWQGPLRAEALDLGKEDWKQSLGRQGWEDKV